MRFISKAEENHWRMEAGMPADRAETSEAGFFHDSVYKIPGDAGRKTALARLICGRITASDREGMFSITGWGIWPSSENQALFRAVRRSVGEMRTLAEAPGYVFDPSSSRDTEVLEWLVVLALYFSWDGDLLVPHQGLWVRFSHDEVLEIHGQEASTVAEFDSSFDNFGLRAV